MEPREPDLKQIAQPRRDEQPRPEEKKRRFRIVKLEERIAPKGCSAGTDPLSPCGGCGTYTCNPGHCK